MKIRSCMTALCTCIVALIAVLLIHYHHQVNQTHSAPPPKNETVETHIEHEVTSPLPLIPSVEVAPVRGVPHVVEVITTQTVEKKDYGFPVPFIDLPESLKTPHALAVLSNYFALTSQAVTLSNPGLPPYDPPHVSEEPTDEEIEKWDAYHKERNEIVSSKRTENLKNGYFLRAANARAAIREHVQKLPELLGENAYKDFKRWQTADRTAAILSMELPEGETRTAATEIAKMWSEGYPAERIMDSFASIRALDNNPEMREALLEGLRRR